MHVLQRRMAATVPAVGACDLTSAIPWRPFRGKAPLKLHSHLKNEQIKFQHFPPQSCVPSSTYIQCGAQESTSLSRHHVHMCMCAGMWPRTHPSQACALSPALRRMAHISLYGTRRLQPQSRQEPRVLKAVRNLQHLLAKARKQPFLCHYRVTNVDKEEKMTNHVYLKYCTAKMNIFFPRRKGLSLRSFCLGRHVENGLMAMQSPTCPDGAGTTPRNRALQSRAKPAAAFEPQMDPQSPGAEHMQTTKISVSTYRLQRKKRR